MDIKQLKEMIKDLPDDAEVLYSDPNFSGRYHIVPDRSNFSINENHRQKALFIEFPFETPVS